LADPGKDDLRSKRHTIDLGLYAGVVFPARAHELYDQQAWQEPLDVVAFDVGLRMGYMPWPFIGIELEGGVMPTETREGGDGALLYTFRGHVVGQYPARLSPFVLVGYGLLGVSSSESAVGEDVDGAFHTGLGLKFFAVPRLTARLDGRIIISGRSGPGGVMPHFEVLLGASYTLWRGGDKTRDTDGDGVSDRVDRCPQEMARTKDGCPPKDTDGDGVPDGLDRCPEMTAATKDGCPPKDTDGDGVPDSLDRCPKKMARTRDGCPPKDTDGDGVPDGLDRCPKKMARTGDGCPPKDSDGDGVPDDRDNCPNKAETPNGHQDDDGCPDTVPTRAKRSTGTFKNVHFNVNSIKLWSGMWSEDRLVYRRVVEVLKEQPDLRIRLRGHADETGPKEYNIQLSRKRAIAVRRFLVRRGISRSRLEIEAVGKAEPLSTERTWKARSENRRVEFKIITPTK